MGLVLGLGGVERRADLGPSIGTTMPAHPPRAPSQRAPFIAALVLGATRALAPPPLAAAGARLHHSAVRTRDIEKSLKFYSLLGLDEERRFKSGAARCAWLRSAGGAARLELVEVPDYVDTGRAADGLAPAHVGLNHVALDVGHLCDDLGDFLRRLNDDSERLFEKSLGLALPPRQQIIGQEVYELAFVRDADGVLVELLRKQATLDAPMEPDW